MELVRGPNLHYWLEGGPRSTAAIARVMLAAGEGLRAAHQAGIVHCDVKPDNILIGDDGRPRLADFGVALVGSNRGPEQAERPARRCSARAAALRGTPSYMAPEHHASGLADERSDQFSFFAATYEALSQRRLHARQIDDQTYDELPGRALREVRIPRRLRPVIARGLAAAPADRHADLGEALDAFRRALVPIPLRR
jgi:serine/threonine protein kinase